MTVLTPEQYLDFVSILSNNSTNLYGNKFKNLPTLQEFHKRNR